MGASVRAVHELEQRQRAQRGGGACALSRRQTRHARPLLARCDCQWQWAEDSGCRCVRQVRQRALCADGACSGAALGRMQKCERDALLQCYPVLVHIAPWLALVLLHDTVDWKKLVSQRDPLSACVSAPVAVDSLSRRLPPLQLHQCHLFIHLTHSSCCIGFITLQCSYTIREQPEG